MPAKVKYTNETKANALLTLEANGGNVNATAKQLGIPMPTLRCWSLGQGTGEEVQKLMKARRRPLLDRMEDVLHLILDQIPAKITAAPLPHLITAMGVVADKMALLAQRQMELDGRMGEGTADRATAVAQLLSIAIARQQSSGQSGPGIGHGHGPTHEPALGGPADQQLPHGLIDRLGDEVADQGTQELVPPLGADEGADLPADHPLDLDGK